MKKLNNKLMGDIYALARDLEKVSQPGVGLGLCRAVSRMTAAATVLLGSYFRSFSIPEHKKRIPIDLWTWPEWSSPRSGFALLSSHTGYHIPRSGYMYCT
jgi:hypothetical protein